MVENSRSVQGCHNFPNKIFVNWKLEDNAKNNLTSLRFAIRLFIPSRETRQIHQISG